MRHDFFPRGQAGRLPGSGAPQVVEAVVALAHACRRPHLHCTAHPFVLGPQMAPPVNAMEKRETPGRTAGIEPRTTELSRFNPFVKGLKPSPKETQLHCPARTAPAGAAKRSKHSFFLQLQLDQKPRFLAGLCH